MSEGAQFLPWLKEPVLWLGVAVVLVMIEGLFDTFYCGGFAIGAVCAAGALLLHGETPALWGEPLAVFGLGSVIGLSVLRRVCRADNRHSDPNDDDY